MAVEKEVKENEEDLKKKEEQLSKQKQLSEKEHQESSVSLPQKPEMKDVSLQTTDEDDEPIEIKNMEVLEKCTIEEITGNKFITSLKGFRYAFKNTIYKKNDIIRVGIDNHKNVIFLDPHRVIE